MTGIDHVESPTAQAEASSGQLGGPPLRSSLIAGVFSGIAGLATFMTIHALWIVPIWFVAPIGLVIAMAGGVAVAWAFHELRPHRN